MLRFFIALCVLGILAYSQVRAAERVRVAVFNNPPLMTYSASERQPGGIFMNVLRYTAAREGWDLEYVPGTAAQGFDRLDKGEVDLLAPVPNARSREQRLSFSQETLVTSWGRIFVRRASSIETIADLSGKKVAILQGSMLQQRLVRQAAEAGALPTVLEYPEFAQAFRAVADGHAEAVLANRFTGAIYARETGLRPTTVILDPYGFRFATSPKANNERLLDALDRHLLLLKTDPEAFYYRDLQALEDGARQVVIPAWVHWVGAALVLVLLVALGWALKTRHAAARIARSKGELRAAHEELRRAHEELHRIGVNSPDLIAVFDADYIVRRINRASEQLLGAPPEDVVGTCVLDWVPDECREASRSVLEQVRAGAHLQAHSARIRRADGACTQILWSLAWSQESQELYAIGHDDTERNQLIANLRRRTDQLEVVNRDLQTFAQSVSHDLRSPVAAVIGFVGKVLRDDGHVLQERSRQLLGRAHAASQRMDGIISNLLRLARVTEGGVHRRDCDVTAMCQNIATTLRCQEPDRKVVFEIQPGMRARADRELLRHVFDNLLSNAWKFSAGNPVARVTVAAVSESDGPVFMVQDNGAGFDMAYAHNLFLPFGRLHSESEFDGVGIGLCVAHRVVAAHGGRIWAESAPGTGAIFRFTLAEADLEVRSSAEPSSGGMPCVP